jgi:hypothetical protein
MPKQWFGRVGVALSLVQVIYSYRRSRLPRKGRALQLLPRILLLTWQMFRPFPQRSEPWFVGGQMLGLALTILARTDCPHPLDGRAPRAWRGGIAA